jgi:hypothetical protein
MKLHTPGGLDAIRPQTPESSSSFGQPTTLALEIPEKPSTLMREPTAIQIEIAIESFLPFRELEPVVQTRQLEPVGLARPAPRPELANIRIAEAVA